MKRIIKCLLLILVSILVLGCGKGEVTIVTYSVNPSIEIVYSEDGKVGSVTAYNDDGSILLSGEDFVGLTASKATENFLNLCVDLGYLTSESGEIEIYVSGDSEYSSKIKEKIEKSVNKVLDKLDLESKFEGVKSYTEESVDGLLKNMNYTSEDLASMDLNQKLRIVLEERIKTKNLPTIDYIALYYSVLESRVLLVNYEVFQTYMTDLSEAAQKLYDITSGLYTEAINAYINYVNVLIDTYNLHLFGENSIYQQSLKAYVNAKADLDKEKEELDTLTKDSKEYQEKAAIIEEKEAVLADCRVALDLAKKNAESYINAAKIILNTGKEAFEKAFRIISSTMQKYYNVDEFEAASKEQKETIQVTYISKFLEIHKEYLDELNKVLQEEKEALSN